MLGFSSLCVVVCLVFAKRIVFYFIYSSLKLTLFKFKKSVSLCNIFCRKIVATDYTDKNQRFLVFD